VALTSDEQKLLDELTAKASAPDADDFEIEIFSGDKGARVPISKAGKWLFDNFGIGDAPAAPAADSAGGDQADKGDKQQAGAPARGSYFGKKAAK
jgi:hypothetical protein